MYMRVLSPSLDEPSDQHTTSNPSEEGAKIFQNDWRCIESQSPCSVLMADLSIFSRQVERSGQKYDFYISSLVTARDCQSTPPAEDTGFNDED